MQGNIHFGDRIMRKVKLVNTLLTHFKSGDIIDMYSEEEVLASNINKSEREWVNTTGGFIGFCLSGYPNGANDTIDYTGLFPEDIEEV